ncbi:MAG: hypothetical protein M3Y80_06055, partial [Verrucomicrobiota bacterium]|nr:hypothetical protein [Verrucomicrobiota bacterium]
LLAADPQSESRKSDLAFTEARLGEAQAASGNNEAALQSYRAALALRGPAQLTDSANARERQNLSLLEAGMAKALAATGQTNEGLGYFEQAISLAEKLSAAAPSNAKLRTELALRYAEIASFHCQNSNSAKARDYFERSLRVWEDLQETGRLFPLYANKPAEVMGALARCEASRGQVPEQGSGAAAN